MDMTEYEEELIGVAESLLLKRKEYVGCSKRLLEKGLYLDTPFFLASLDRGMRLIDGFVPQLKSRNIVCGSAMYRMMIDLSMRVYACFIAANREAFLTGFARGKDPKEYKDKAGNKMSDGYLKRLLDSKCPGLKKDYDLASGFIHFSQESLLLMSEVEGDLKTLKMTFGEDYGEKINEDLISLGSAFHDACRLHLELVRAVIKSR